MSRQNMNTESPYDYSTRTGVRPISWNDFHGLTKALAVAVSPWKPEIILPVGRGGYYPGSLLAHILQLEIYPVRLSRREQDIVVRESPQWIIAPPNSVNMHRVLVVDEICSTGETLSMVRDRTLSLGATEVRTAVLYAHVGGSGVPDYVGIITDELVLNPWDREIYVNGEFRYHPEYVEALAHQGGDVDQVLLIPSPKYVVEKGIESTRASI